jgi:hypothetical protein
VAGASQCWWCRRCEPFDDLDDLFRGRVRASERERELGCGAGGGAVDNSSSPYEPLRQFYDGACRIQMSDNFAVSYVSRLLFPMARYKQSLYATHLEIILNLPRYMYVQIGLRLTFTPKHIFP